MAEDLGKALARLRALLLDSEGLARAVAAGRRRGAQPRWRRVELRYVDLKAGRRLQITRYDDTQAHTSNHGADAADEIEALLAEPFGNWHLETAAETVQVRVTKGGAAMVGVQRRESGGAGRGPDRAHDRAKRRLLPEDDPVLRELGISDERGRIKPSRRAKHRQVEEFLRELAAAIDAARAAGLLPAPGQRPLRVVDLGCGNAYLTFAAHAWLTRVAGIPAQVTGIDVKKQARGHNAAIAERLGVSEEVDFAVASIAGAELAERPDVVLALHACDTATDDALARALAWRAPVILAAPCCHHDLSRQLRDRSGEAFGGMVRDGILRERLADTLTDALRAGLMRASGYRVDVVEFVDSEHTPRNTLIRALDTGADGRRAAAEVEELTGAWGVRPRLAELIGR